MTTLLARVLLSLAFVAIASAQTCPLCPNGGNPGNGNAVLFDDGIDSLTCEEVSLMGISPAVDGSCADSFAYAIQSLCKCPGVKAGSCPGICRPGFILAQPDQGTELFGITCSVFDQFLRGEPGDTTCDAGMASSGFKGICKCKVKVKPDQNMGGGGVGGNGGAGTGMMGMSGGRQRRLGGLEEHFPPRAARGLAM